MWPFSLTQRQRLNLLHREIDDLERRWILLEEWVTEIALETHRIGLEIGGIFKQQESEMADLAKLQQDITDQVTVIDSVSTLLTGLSGQIAALKGQVSQDPTTQAAIDALATQVESNTNALATAVTANTVVPPATA